MNKENVMLITGCSHACGSEIDGTEESAYNRQNSFGNLLAKKAKYRPVNIASSGCTNSTIARSVIEWIEYNYNPNTMNLFVLIAWTESSRLEIPAENPIWYGEVDTFSDYKSITSHHYYRINLGLTQEGTSIKDLASYQKFIVNNQDYFEMSNAINVLQTQYFLNSLNINYLMCNTMHMFTESKYIKFYLDQIDKRRYVDMLDNEKSFYWFYKNAGYENPKAKYWHHNEEPHELYAKKLYKIFKN